MFNLHIIEKRRWYFLASGILIVLSVIALTISAILSGLPVQLDFDATGPETLRAAGLAIPIAAITVLAFVWWSFRRTPGALRYGACAITVIAHNLVVLLGFYALMGLLVGWQADTATVVAVLTTIGLSAQDAIVTFERIRKNAARRRSESQEMVISRSILEILAPTLITRLWLLFILVAVTLAGGPTVAPFTATLLVGVICETYAAIFIAVPLLTI